MPGALPAGGGSLEAPCREPGLSHSDCPLLLFFSPSRQPAAEAAFEKEPLEGPVGSSSHLGGLWGCGEGRAGTGAPGQVGQPPLAKQACSSHTALLGLPGARQSGSRGLPVSPPQYFPSRCLSFPISLQPFAQQSAATLHDLCEAPLLLQSKAETSPYR